MGSEGNKKKPDIEKMKSLLEKVRKIWLPMHETERGEHQFYDLFPT